jgi:TRAP transporter TAXI family solute receptor
MDRPLETIGFGVGSARRRLGAQTEGEVLVRHSIPLARSRRVLLLSLSLSLVLVLAGTGCDKLKELQKQAEEAKEKADKKQKEKEDAARTILTGSKEGNYYKAAKELNKIAGADLELVESSGSFDNLEKLGQGQAGYAIVQFDTLIMFLRMGGANKDWANNSLGVAPLSNELIHIIVRKKANIHKLEDLKNKRIGAGSARSGSFVSAFTIMAFFNDVNLEKYRNTFNEPYEDSLEKLQKGELDALFITSAAGMPLLKKLDASASKDIELLDVGEKIKIPEGIDYTYVIEPMPKDTYPWQTKEIHTLATPGYLFAYHALDPKAVREVTAAIYDKADKLRKKSNLWTLVSVERAKQDMKFGIAFHPGAQQYFDEAKE